MIQLYVKGNSDYENNGNHVICPTSCIVDRQLNGAWELTMKAPIDEEKKHEDITTEAVIKAPTPDGDRLFWIYDTDKESEDSVIALARPIFLCAAKDAFMMDTRVVNKNGQEALDIITEGTRYSGKSNITKTNTAYYVRKNLVQAIASDDDNSFLNRWGGEVLYKDFEVVVNERVGGDYGTSILYGKNLKSIKEHVNIEELVTRIVPVAYNGYTLPDTEKWVDSPLINNYTHVHVKTIHYSDVKLLEDTNGDEIGYETLEELQEELRRRCRMEYAAGIDKPKVTLEVDMVDLSKTVEYEGYSVLEEVSLGDTVHCQHNRLGISTTARVIRQKWDCIQKRNEELVIGDFENNYFNKLTSTAKSLSSVIRSDGTIMAEKIQGVLDAMYTQLRLQSTAAKKVSGRVFMVEDLDQESPLYGAMVWGTQGLQIATQRTEDGKDWDWSSALTAKGLLANIIVAGVLTDKEGQNYWNLDTGEFRLSSSAFKVDEVLIDEYINGKIGDLAGLTMNISNEFQIISTDSEGNYTEFPETKTTAYVYFGKTDVSSKCVYAISKTASIDGTWDEDTRTFTVTGLTEDNGHVDIIATYMGNYEVSKRFVVSKLKGGEVGVEYMIQPTVDIIKRGADNKLTPEAITFYGYYREGSSMIRNEFSGWFKVYESVDGTEYTLEYASATEETYVTYTPSENASQIRCELYGTPEEGEDILVGQKTIPVLVDIANLSHEQVFNLLTLDGQLKGIYKEGNQLYISFTYAKGGTLKLGGKSNGNGVLEMLDADGENIGKWDNNGLLLYKGEINGVKIIVTEGEIGGFELKDGELVATNKDKQILISPNCVRSATEGGYAELVDAALFFYEAMVVEEGVPADSGVQVGGIDFGGMYGRDIDYILSFDRYLHDTWYSDGMYFTGDIYSEANMYINGEKNRVVDTEHYGTRCINAYETATPYFGDLGTDTLKEDGTCIVQIDKIFQEVVTFDYEYQVFLQKEGQGEIWVDSKESTFFVTKGTPGLKFSWELKAIQIDRTPKDRLKQIAKPVKGEKK